MGNPEHPGENPHRHMENMQTLQNKGPQVANWFEPRTFNIPLKLTKVYEGKENLNKPSLIKTNLILK